MKQISLKFVQKFWTTMALLDRGTSDYYPNQACQRDVFTRRVAKLFIKEGTYRIGINGKFYVVALHPSLIRFAYARADKLVLNLYHTTSEPEQVTISHNESLRVSWEEISKEKFIEVCDFCWGSLEDRFMNAYSFTHQYFEKHIKEISAHTTTALIYKRLSGHITDDVLKGVADLITATEIWSDGTGFYINQDKEVRKKMPSGYAFHYLEDVKKTITKFGYLKYEKEPCLR